MEYQLTYAGVPFTLDVARVVKMGFEKSTPDVDGPSAPQKHQPLSDLVDELNRIIPFCYMQDFTSSSDFPDRNLSAIASLPHMSDPVPEIRIGDWYYPSTASHWSVFRGLATSSQVKEMLNQTRGYQGKPLVMKVLPESPGLGSNSQYIVTSTMFMLPPRPLAEHGGQYDGLYLITLVDERYYFQWSPVSLRVKEGTTWQGLIAQIGNILGITITYNISSFPDTLPEPDSQFWTNQESAARLLDAIAYNLSATVVRNLDGTYVIMDTVTSQSTAINNRGYASQIVRTAGGEFFASGSSAKPGNLTLGKNSVIPSLVNVTFPKYVYGDDPVPHFVNPRVSPQRQSIWFEESYGDVHIIPVPISSGGINASGLTGIGSDYVHTPAKALYATEATAFSGNPPVNQSGLTSLAMFVAKNIYDSQVSVAYDETYPGTFAWTPEGIHEIIWTYSARERKGTTRIVKMEWNNSPLEMQYSAPALSGSTNVPRGVGGPGVALTVRDQFSGSVTSTTEGIIGSGDTTFLFASGSMSGFPQVDRWRGATSSGEVILFEGLSGGSTAGVVYRAIDGTLPAQYPSGITVRQVVPNTTYGTNLLTFGPSFKAYPGAWTSGGIQESRITIAPGGITSGMIGSGVIITSGMIGSGTIIIGSGTTIVYSGMIASGAIFSGLFNSGTIIITSGMYGSGVQILSGMMGSGSVTNNWIIGSGALASNNLSEINWYINYNNYFSYTPTYYTALILSGSLLNPGNTVKLALISSGNSNPIVRGIAGGVHGRILYLWNVGSGVVDFEHMGDGLNSVYCPLRRYYSLWGKDSCILEYDGVSGVWRFDHPTFGVGGSEPLPAVYHCRHIKFTSGLEVINNLDGSADVYNSRAGITSGMDWNSYRHASSLRVGGSVQPMNDTHYLGGQITGQVRNNAFLQRDMIYLMPFISPRGGTTQYISCAISLAISGALIKMGIYRTVSNKDLYPTILDAEATEITSGTFYAGLQVSPITLSFNTNRLYWLALTTDKNINVEGFDVGDALYPVLGNATLRLISGQYTSGADSSGLGYIGTPLTSWLYSGYIYDGSLPDPLPSGAIAMGVNSPAIGIKYLN